jgi:hypothetical protein
MSRSPERRAQSPTSDRGYASAVKLLDGAEAHNIESHNVGLPQP